MLYIVSGFVRSGTSMMMDALIAGGMAAEWSRERDEAMNRKFADEHFKPNESYREVALTEYSDLDFPLKYDGKLIKVMSWGLAQMRRIPHRIVFMLRDPWEIAESYERSFGKAMSINVRGIEMRVEASPLSPYANDPYNDLVSDEARWWRSEGAVAWKRRYEAMTKAAIVAAESRKDCDELIALNYADVLADPPGVFTRLSDIFPIDPAKAAAVVDKQRKRVA